MLGGRHGEKVEPVKEGDILMTKPFGRVVVTRADDNIHGPVYVAIRFDNGNDCIVLDREVMYRSR